MFGTSAQNRSSQQAKIIISLCSKIAALAFSPSNSRKSKKKKAKGVTQDFWELLPEIN